ncbi:MAG TPA: hypothetical protein DEV93_03230 [Chloroflexi bacterium]|jgi:hypothetical protein|nr:hypothetical protein [Chloroflexota bacterium]
MSIAILFVLLFVIAVYWFITQIMPERQRLSLLRPGLADGLLEKINDRRHERGLPMLEIDDSLMAVAETKATHQLMTGLDDEGWEYPSEYAEIFGKSLLMEALVAGPSTAMPDRLLRQREIFDGEWVRCGIGVAGGASNQVVVALILCRESWEPLAAARHRSLLQRLVRM